MTRHVRKLEVAFARSYVAAAALLMLVITGHANAQSVELAWNTSPAVHRYRYSDASPGGERHKVELDVRADGTAFLKLDAEQPFAVRFSKDGTITLLPGYSGKPPVVPVFTQLFQVGANAGRALRVGESYTFRLPADAEIPDNQLTIQSEVRVKMTELVGDVATLDFETAYRLVKNPALDAFRADVSDLRPSQDNTYLDGILGQATSFRLAGFGSVQFDRSAGHMISARFTGAGLPLSSLSPDQLARDRNAFTYGLVRVD